MQLIFPVYRTQTFLVWLFVACSLTFSTSAVFSQQSGLYDKMHLKADANGIYEVSIYKSGVVRLDKPAKRISVGNPGIADILILRNRELYIVGKALGSTNITVWDNKHRIIASFGINVTHDLNNLKLQLHRLMPDEPIEVRSAQKRIILSGEVSNVVKMNAAVNLAESFLPDCGEGGKDCKGGVLNLMQIGGAQQVMLEVKIAEVSRQLKRKLDTQFSYAKLSNGIRNLGGIVTGGTPTLLPGNSTIIPPAAIGDNSIFFTRLGSDYLISAMIDASKENGLVKILAEPTLLTLTGQQAQFLSGGEFPIPVSGGDGEVTVEFKEFGVGLKFLPVVLDSGRINMKLNVDVSEISNANNVILNVDQTVGSIFIIPGLTKRSAESTVELADGQTIGIAGLLSDNTRAIVDRLPGIGEVPVLGALFSSQEYLSGQTELVIFVTPHLAKPIAAEKIRLPTDAYVPPNDLEFYLLGRLEGRQENVDESQQPSYAPTTSEAGGLDGGYFGHSL